MTELITPDHGDVESNRTHTGYRNFVRAVCHQNCGMRCVLAAVMCRPCTTCWAWLTRQVDTCASIYWITPLQRCNDDTKRINSAYCSYSGSRLTGALLIPKLVPVAWPPCSDPDQVCAPSRAPSSDPAFPSAQPGLPAPRAEPRAGSSVVDGFAPCSVAAADVTDDSGSGMRCAATSALPIAVPTWPPAGPVRCDRSFKSSRLCTATCRAKSSSASISAWWARLLSCPDRRFRRGVVLGTLGSDVRLALRGAEAHDRSTLARLHVLRQQVCLPHKRMRKHAVALSARTPRAAHRALRDARLLCAIPRVVVQRTHRVGHLGLAASDGAARAPRLGAVRRCLCSDAGMLLAPLRGRAGCRFAVHLGHRRHDVAHL
eukprot:352421-Chlamydomonas_euryale.AAC.61